MGENNTAHRANLALELFELLSSSPGGIVDIGEAQRALGCSRQDLMRAVDVISSLADRETGARAIVYQDGDRIVSEGEASHLLPLRLTPAEAEALKSVFSSLCIDESVQKRVARALLPEDSSPFSSQIASADPYGSWYQCLAEAIADGVRCVIEYRSHDEDEPSRRLIDPISIESSTAGVYLNAWNVEKKEAHRYRLERISDLEFTDDSVEPHPGTVKSLEENMSQLPQAIIRIAAEGNPPTWARTRGLPDISGRVLAEVSVASEPWLFDQVLASNGLIEIVSPRDLRCRLLEYANKLLSNDGQPSGSD